ncbi:MAG: DUF4102 domain-containing protein [Candidatus Obscuribacter sp.]|nr:DUF4102 domain-containing protein [Candidatus Obscuribacter sp.]MBK9277975.1 DUF4102 domain-containing protein [Candidatus Obscuribacter sp.]
MVEGRVNGVSRRLTLGRDGALTPAAARKKARRLLSLMAADNDPLIKNR